MSSWIEETLGIGESTVNRILASALIIAIVLVIRWWVARAINRRLDDPESWFRTRKTSTYVAAVVLILALWRIWFTGTDDLATFLGLLSAGLAIALADVLKNLAGWLYIVSRKPFRVGDRIQIGEHIGDVVDIRAFRFSILEIQNWVDADQTTGRIVDIPNGRTITEPSANYTEGFTHIFHEVPVLVTFESDRRRAEELIREAMFEVAPDPAEVAAAEVREAAMEFLIRLPQLEPGTYVSVKDSGVLITARMLIKATERRGIDDLMWRAILDRFDAEPTVNLAYNTVRAFLPDAVAVQGPNDYTTTK